MDEDELLAKLAALEIETPSWGYGNSGTRFHVYPVARRRARPSGSGSTTRRSCTGSPAAARPSRSTSRGIASTTGVALRRYAEPSAASGSARSTRTSSATTTTGSGASATRTSACARQALDHCRECIEIAGRVGSPIVSLWLADGTNYPGQDDLRSRHARLAAGLEELYALCRRACACSSSTSSSSRRFYCTDLPDWGTAALALPAPRPAGAGARRHGPPPAGDERRADRRRAARRGPARRLPLQQPQVRRRRPDRRRRSTRSSSSGSCARSRTRTRRRRRRVHDRPVAQRRGQDRRDDPVGHEHPDARTRRRCSSMERDSPRPRPRATCSAPTGSCSRRSRPTCGRCSRASAASLGVERRPRRGVPGGRLRGAPRRRARNGIGRERVRATVTG